MRDVSFRHRLEYLALRLAECELLQLSPGRALRFAEGFGALAYRLLEGRSRTGRENLQQAFPESSPGEIDVLLKEVYANLFRLAAEIFLTRRLIRHYNWKDYVQVENGEFALDVYLEGRGGILVSGHLGNWELLGHAIEYLGLRSEVMVRPLDNPLIDRYILGLRAPGGARTILKRGSGARVEELLAKGGFLSLLVDQDAGTKGAFVPFMGRLASTWRSPALLSMMTGAPVVPGCCVRVGKGLEFKVLVGEPVYPRDTADVSSETLRITQGFTRQLEGWVREYPEQYLWLHRRWKSAPGRGSLVAAGREG